ncbi:DUF2062 domain-containing protein [Leptonema illini]|uniref:DUF2062 domain-containing protein n=1 Tax=Leptonema illini DSM 21528 TaxID=929563 RepID=H2CBC0_9LEPT|nr:DUF2062 domain-containing protein [Leptonema illini]EHQ06291.1 Protein of unknown function DUF2062 [Leptonema illini DSM 21528]
MLRRLWTIIDERLIMPFRESHAPVEEVARGTVVGLIWALTPLVGIQMYLVFMTWTIARLLRIRFSLAIGIALVWITNPLTMAFFYYGFYETGRFFLQFMNLMHSDPITMERIAVLVDAAGQKSLIDGLIYWFETFLRDFGIPSLIGGFVWGGISSVVAYPFTIRMMNRHRTRLAEKEGLTLAEWEKRHIHRFADLARHGKEELPPYVGEHEAPAEAVARTGFQPPSTGRPAKPAARPAKKATSQTRNKSSANAKQASAKHANSKTGKKKASSSDKAGPRKKKSA